MRISRMKLCRLVPLIGLSSAVPTYIGQSSSVCTWGEWCSFSDCTTEDGLAAQCGVAGTQVRSRECDCPDGHSGEPDCPGGVSGMFEEQPCSGPCDCDDCGDDCPAECSDNCAPCAPSYDGDDLCPKGCPSAADVCDLGEFPDFPECPSVCGNPAGTNVTVTAPCECRMYENDPKNCENLLCGDEPCKSTDSQSCSSDECCSLGDWSEWGTCAECRNDGDEPISTRSRVCDCKDDSNCDGAQTEETRPCTQDETPPCVTCDWAGWCPWSACSATCEEGEQQRTRKCACSDGTESDSECEGEAAEVQPCNDGPCPPECAWSGWCPWSSCSADCEQSGNSTRSRSCWCEDGSDSCEGESEESMPCEGEECPVECEWAGWCGWGECSATCSEDGNPAMHTRSRQCKCTKGEADIKASEGDCTGDADETEPCADAPACAVRDCQWAGWCAWGDCSATCGEATQERTRACRCIEEELDGSTAEVYAREGDCGDEPSAQIQPCEGLEECLDNGNDNCNDDGECGVDGCVWGEWCPWSSCSDDCGGDRTRTRKCSCEDQASCPGSYEEREECTDGCTEVLESDLDGDDGTGELDGGNTGEDKGFGGAEKDNIDPSTGGEGDGNGEMGLNGVDPFDGIDSSGKSSGDDLPLTPTPSTDDIAATERECWSPWSDWTECGGATEECPCGGCGTQTRNRDCQCGDSPDCPGCDGAPAEDEQACDANQASCNLGEWSEWTSCNSTCGAGAVSERNRDCACPEGALAGCTNGCDGELHEELACGDQAPPCCAYSEWCGWSECSKECDSGTHTRSRECRCEDWQGNEFTSDTDCGGPSPHFEDEVCNSQSCDGSDNKNCPDGDCKSECEKTCESDENPEDCTQKCTDDGLEPNGCTMGEWNPWSDCTGDCESEGLQERTRSCSCPETSADVCEDLSSETQPCTAPACPTEAPTEVPATSASDCNGSDCPTSDCNDDSTCPPADCTDDSCSTNNDDCDDDNCGSGDGEDSTPAVTIPVCDNDDCVIEPTEPTDNITVGNDECCDEPECGDCKEDGSGPATPEDDDEDCVDDCPVVEPEECPPEGGTVEPEEPAVPTNIPTIEGVECPTDGCKDDTTDNTELGPEVPEATTFGGCTDSTCEPDSIPAETVTPSAPVTPTVVEPESDCRGDSCEPEPELSGSGDVECPDDECPDTDCPAGDCNLQNVH